MPIPQLLIADSVRLFIGENQGFIVELQPS